MPATAEGNKIAGVCYECSQDVTNLHEYVRFHDLRLGFPVGVI